MSKTNQGQVNIYNHADKEEEPEEYGKLLYVDVSSLADEVKATLEKENPDYEVELCGVERWEW